ncbi:MAG TPA: SDR family NAD(P)-dependent oxidoreductase [Dongiaceae bacterium]|nr:SDR family NAD(P)-dependent oxidoreductase [Dongiaceae bacterium]
MIRTALVTGANRGIGLEVCRQLAMRGCRVVLTARREVAGRAAAARLAADGLEVRFERLDVTHEEDGAVCAERLASAGVTVDVLVNNAGIYPEGGFFTTPSATYREALDTNALGALWTCRAFVPGMLSRGYGRVVNVSSDYGSFGEGLAGPASYSVSKAALGAITVKLAQEVRGDVKVNGAHPGWVRTDMGGPGAHLPVEEGADTIVWLATLPADGPNGVLFHRRKPIPW